VAEFEVLVFQHARATWRTASPRFHVANRSGFQEFSVTMDAQRIRIVCLRNQISVFYHGDGTTAARGDFTNACVGFYAVRVD
jgi:hypothetical protein